MRTFDLAILLRLFIDYDVMDLVDKACFEMVNHQHSTTFNNEM